MGVIPAQIIRQIVPPIVSPFAERNVVCGRSVGLSIAGYDVASDGFYMLAPGERILMATKEKFQMPLDVIAVVHDKSSYVREWLTVQNTVIEPGWRGYLTLEVINHSKHFHCFKHDQAVAQILFHALVEPAETGYSGKYQDQEAGPQKARLEGI